MTIDAPPPIPKIKRKRYERLLLELQLQLVHLQTHMRQAGERIVIVF